MHKSLSILSCSAAAEMPKKFHCFRANSTSEPRIWICSRGHVHKYHTHLPHQLYWQCSNEFGVIRMRVSWNWYEQYSSRCSGSVKVLRLLIISPDRDEVPQKRKKNREVYTWATCTPIWGTSACSNCSETLRQAPKWPKIAQKQWKTLILSRLPLIYPAWAVRWWPNPGTFRNYVSMLAMQNCFPNAQILTDI